MKTHTKATHTPGPWQPEGQDLRSRVGDHDWWVTAPKGRQGTFLPAVCSGPDAEANARLIAAAPTLLEALQLLVDAPQGCRCENNGGGDCEWCSRARDARAAIADATRGAP